LYLALLASVRPGHAAESELLPVGSTAPAFESVDVDGKPFVLAEVLKTKRVLLAFWSISCGTCRDELPILEMEMPKYADKVQFATVNIDDDMPRARAIAVIKNFVKQQNLTYPMLLNKSETTEYKIFQAYQVKFTPTLYLINKDGSIAYGHSSAISPEELAEVFAKAE
jgi:peroxiredoxin